MKQKLVFITGTMSSGGAERVISVLANELVKQYDVEIICVKSTEIFYSLDSSIHITILPENVKKNNYFLKSLWFRKYVKGMNKPILISFMAQIYFFTKISLFGLKRPIIASERIDPKGSKLIFQILRKCLYPFANLIVVQTNDIKKYFSRKLQKNISIILNPISSKFINGSAITTKAENLIVTVGRLTSQKNHILLIKAFESIRKEIPGFKLKIYGVGPLQEFLESYIKENNLQNDIELPGATDNIVGIFNEAKLFILSSNFEGMSNALIEAMYVGLPVISTRISGSTDLIDNGKNGILVDVNNQLQLEKAMKEILLDVNLAQELGRNASSINKLVNKEVVLNHWKVAIKSVL
jgi:glycosyltransferase involved in cell wall biosynthesis